MGNTEGLGNVRAKPTLYTFGEFAIDLTRYELRRAGRLVALEPKVFDLLGCLITRRDRVISKNELLDAIWPNEHVTESSLERCISLARKALGAEIGRHAVIQTVHGRGYRFVAPLVAGTPAPPLAIDSESAGADFVGREAELALARAALESARAGAGSLLLVSGEPGIGKTRTAEECMGVARRAGFAARIGRCREEDGAAPFWPWRQLLRAEIEEHAPDTLRQLLGAGASDLASIVPELSLLLPGLPPSPPLQSAQARLRLFDSVARFLERLSQAQPRLLVLDDLHRADEPSLCLLEFVAATLGALRVVVIGTHRPLVRDRASRRGRLLAEISRVGAVRTFALSALSRAEVARFMAAAGCTVSEPAVVLLHEQSGGNPFFLRQLTPLLAPRDGVGADRASTLAAGLPQSVREAVARQLDVLSPRARRVLQAAAVIGREFALDVLERVVSIAPAQVADALDAALCAGLVAPHPDHTGGYRFAHALVRDVAYRCVRRSDRARLHGRVLEALEVLSGTDIDAHLPSLAAHALEARSLDNGGRAVRYAARAAESATRHFAYEEAARHYECALDVLRHTAPDDRAQTCELLLGLAESQVRAGHYADAVLTFQRAAALARILGAGAALARAALGVGPVTVSVGVRDDFLVTLLEEALAALEDDEPALRAALFGRLAIALYWAPAAERRTQLSDEAVHLAARSGDEATLAYATVARCVALWSPDNSDERRRHLQAALSAAVQQGDLERALAYRMFWITTLLERGEATAALQEVATLTREANHLRQPHGLWNATLLQVMVAGFAGRIDDAERLALEYWDRASPVDTVNAPQSFAAALAMVRREQGRVAELVDHAGALAARLPTVAVWRCALLWVLAHAGRRDEAARELAELAAERFRSLPFNLHWPVQMALLSEGCALLGDGDRAEVLGELLAPYADRHVVAGFGAAYWGPVAYFLAINAATAQRWEDAEHWFDSAVTRARQIGAGTWMVRSQLEWARMLNRRGRHTDRAAVRRLVGEALPEAQRLGMPAAGATLMTLSRSAAD